MAEAASAKREKMAAFMAVISRGARVEFTQV
jgi:hypothetical protein